MILDMRMRGESINTYHVLSLVLYADDTTVFAAYLQALQESGHSYIMVAGEGSDPGTFDLITNKITEAYKRGECTDYLAFRAITQCVRVFGIDSIDYCDRARGIYPTLYTACRLRMCNIAELVLCTLQSQRADWKAPGHLSFAPGDGARSRSRLGGRMSLAQVVLAASDKCRKDFVRDYSNDNLIRGGCRGLDEVTFCFMYLLFTRDAPRVDFEHETTAVPPTHAPMSTLGYLFAINNDHYSVCGEPCFPNSLMLMYCIIRAFRVAEERAEIGNPNCHA